MNDQEKKLFRLLFIEQVKFKDIPQKFNNGNAVNTALYDLLKIKYKKEYEKVLRLRNNIYNHKKNTFKEKFQLGKFPEFYDWWMSKGNKCFYCGSEEDKIRALVKAGKDKNPKGIYSSQMRNRGLNLELERVDSKSNIYSKKNCVLVCYFCNNDKSNVITGEDYIKYFKNTKALKYRKKYIDAKYKALKNPE